MIKNLSYVLEKFHKEISKKFTQVSFNNLPGLDAGVASSLNQNIITRKPKDRNDILREYESEKWGRLLSGLVDTKDYSFENVMKEFYGSNKILLYANKDIYDAQILDYHSLISDLISELVRELAGGRPIRLVEFGCGFGGTLVGVANKLTRTGSLSSIVGMDISSSGVQVLNKICEVEELNVESYVHDFSTHHEPFGFSTKDECITIAFTHFSLAAQTTYSTNPLETILKISQPNYLVILEPILCNVPPTTFSRYFTEEHIKNNFYNENIIKFVHSLTEGKLGKVILSAEDVIGASVSNTVSLYVIETSTN